jgi:N-carbamoylputrescine amidase
MVIIAPVYEEEATGTYYNTAAVIDADGKFLGKYRKNHIPHCKPGFWEKFYFKPGNLGYPVFETAVGKVGVYICYDRHFPEEKPWSFGEFYGQSYFANPGGQIIAEGPRDKDAVIVADLNLDMIREVRNVWQFYRDRRPETYKEMSELLP